MQQTTNYQLNKPEASDYADIAPISENMDTIDAQLKTAQNHREDGGVHVTGTDKQNWNSKAPGSLSQTVSQLAQDIEDLQDAVSGGSGDLGGLRDDLDSLESTVSGHTGNSTIHVTSSDKEKWNGYGTVHTLTHQGIQSGAQRLTGLNGATGILSCQFKAVNPYTTSSPNFSIDGVTYTPKLQNGETPDSDLFAANAIVTCVVDTSSRTINFKSGGGLSNSKLALANATAADVAEGKTFYAGNKALKTGTLVPYKYATGTATWTHQSSGFTVTVEVGFRPSMIAFYSQKSLSSSVNSIVGWAYNSSTSNPNYFTGMIMMNVDIYSSHPTYAGYLGEYISVTDTSFTVKSITGSYVAAGDPVTYAVVGQ